MAPKSLVVADLDKAISRDGVRKESRTGNRRETVNSECSFNGPPSSRPVLRRETLSTTAGHEKQGAGPLKRSGRIEAATKKHQPLRWVRCIEVINLLWLCPSQAWGGAVIEWHQVASQWTDSRTDSTGDPFSISLSGLLLSFNSIQLFSFVLLYCVMSNHSRCYGGMERQNSSQFLLMCLNLGIIP